MSNWFKIPNFGRAACNPALQRDLKEIVSERREEIASRMHVAPMGDGYHLLEIPGPDGEPFQTWPGPFESEAAASLFRDELIVARAEGNPADAYCSSGIFEHFNLAGRLLTIIERHGSDNRALANALASERPWATNPPAGTDDETAF